jgi:predicted transcriptional regulator
MNAIQIKKDIYEKLNSLKSNQLEEAYGLFLNFLNEHSESDEKWDQLSKNHQDAILLGLHQLDEGFGITHEEVMSNIRSKLQRD